mgnify:CR=1 FL=1
MGACSPPPPIKIGFIGGLTDRNSDNGQSGLNGVILAVEQFNRAGGVDGRLVELLPKDDAQDKAVAAKSSEELVAAQVEAVVGPFTSSMAQVIVPITGAAGIFQVSPTITSMDFYGKDDNLFRINRTTRDNARDYAQVMVGMGQKRVAVAYDTRNKNFTESWLTEFRTAANALGAELAAEVPYASGTDTDFDNRAGDHHDGMEYFGLSASGTADASSTVPAGLSLSDALVDGVYVAGEGVALDGRDAAQ